MAKKSTALAVKDDDQHRNPQVLAGRGYGWSLTLTDDIAEEIVAHVREGMPLTLAGHLVGISQSTLASQLQRGEENPEGTFGPFAMAIRKAQAEFVQEAIRGIKDAGLSDAKQWTALMTLLERIYPEYFKRPSDKGMTVGQIVIGQVEAKVHELHLNGELVYDGG